MRRSALFGALGASVAWGALAHAAEPTPPAKAETPSWYSRFTPTLPGDKSADKKPDAAPVQPLVAVAPLEPAALAEALKAEQDAWGRRLEVCLKLRVIGNDANDEALLKQANDLEKQATALYHSRVARLGVKAPLRGKSEAALAETPATTPARVFKVVTP